MESPAVLSSATHSLASPSTTAATASVRTVWIVAAVVLAFHGVWIGSYLADGHEARDFIKIGTFWEGMSNSSPVIKVDPNYVPPRNRGSIQGSGYDGQFSYYMALDFANAHDYMDFPAYRYSRLLYPMVARAASLGDPRSIPIAMIAINWLALGGCALALAAWLRRRSCSPWLALIVGLYPGLLLGLQRDLTEPLAYSLVAAGVYLFDYGGRHRLLWAGVIFGLAGLARQTTLVFPLCLLAAALLSGARDVPIRKQISANALTAAAFGLLAILPFVVYSGILYVWLGALDKGAFLERWPLIGIATSGNWAFKRQGVELVTVVAPALIIAALAIAALLRGSWRVEFAFLLGNVLVFVVLLSRLSYRDGYTSTGRVTTGVVLAAVLCIPWLRDRGQQVRRALTVSFALWLSMLPVIFVYGFGG